MIKIIFKSGNRVKNKKELNLIETFKKNGISFETIASDHLTKEELIKVLILTYNGFDDIVVGRPQNEKIKELKEYCYEFNFNRAVEFLIIHPELVKTPIIYDDKAMLVSTQTEKIKYFLYSRVK